MTRKLFLPLLSLAASLVALLLAVGARAHDWYHDLKQPGTGISCCSDKDCRPTIGELREDGWYASVNGVMVPVPASKVLHISPPDGRSHVCDAGYGIICFIPSEPRS